MSKKIKALLAVVLCAVMLVAAASPAFAAVDNNGVLRFNKDGKFKIMQISDTQDIDVPREATIMFMEKALDAEKPDLVVFTGDQLAGGKIETAEGVYAGIKAILQPVVDRGIPFTVVFGNHDNDDGCPVSRDEQFAYYQTFPGCLAYDAVPEMYGTGTHNLPIYASEGSETKFNLWMIDSNDYDRVNGGYDYVHQDQIDWYEKTSKALEEKEGHLVPSIAFQHIIVPEVAELLVDSPFSGENAISKVINGENKLLMLKPGKASGILLEFPCPSNTNSGQFASWKERGDVIAASFGHDHINTFIGNVDGIDLVMCPGVTFQSYGRYITRAVRIFELDENDPWSYDTHLYKFTDAFGWGLYSWYVGAKYGQSPVMWIPIALAGVLGVAAGVGTIVMINNIVIGATATAGVIALIYFITHSQQ
ncbi:MAG TPA: hypothetical protein DEQ52_06780 [Ruminococcaceae bacterium]|nr:hypothetical protein [Oscillospiraceae bacterium]